MHTHQNFCAHRLQKIRGNIASISSLINLDKKIIESSIDGEFLKKVIEAKLKGISKLPTSEDQAVA